MGSVCLALRFFFFSDSPSILAMDADVGGRDVRREDEAADGIVKMGEVVVSGKCARIAWWYANKLASDNAILSAARHESIAGSEIR